MSEKIQRTVKINDDMKLIIDMDQETDIMTVSSELNLISKIVKAVTMASTSVNEITDVPKYKRPYVMKNRKNRICTNENMIEQLKDYYSSTLGEREGLARKYGYNPKRNFAHIVYKHKQKLKESGIDWMSKVIITSQADKVNLEKGKKIKKTRSGNIEEEQKKPHSWTKGQEEQLMMLHKSGIKTGVMATYFELEPKQITDKIYIMKKKEE